MGDTIFLLGINGNQLERAAGTIAHPPALMVDKCCIMAEDHRIQTPPPVATSYLALHQPNTVALANKLTFILAGGMHNTDL